MNCALCATEVAAESAIEGAFCVRCAAQLPPPVKEMPKETPTVTVSHELTPGEMKRARESLAGLEFVPAGKELFRSAEPPIEGADEPEHHSKKKGHK